MYPERRSSKNYQNKLRVIFIDHTAQLGGGEIALDNLLQHIDPAQFEACVLLCAEGPLVERLRKRHPVHILPLTSRIAGARRTSIGWKSLLRLRDLVSGLVYAWRLSRYIRRLRADVVHTNSLKANLLGGLAARLARVPVIWYVRDRISSDYLPRGAVQLVRVLSKIIPTFIIANSRATLDTLIGHAPNIGLRNSGRCRVVHDGCDVPALSRHPDPMVPPTVGLIGRISPWKGQHIFIRAAAMVRREFPAVRFQIIGAPLFSESDYEMELKRLTRELQLEHHVEFAGFVHDVQRAFQQLQIVVHASTVGEPFGQVVIEAMAAGKPVIATNGGGIPEIVVDQVTGLLVPMNDARALADALASLLRDPAKAQTMGDLGRERVRNFFTIERTAKAVEEVYLDVLHRKSAHVKLGAAGLQTRVDYES